MEMVLETSMGILESCEVPEGYVPNGTDCDDTEENIFPSAPEICDGLDNNCNEEIDEGLGDAFYMDGDGDGFGDPDTVVESCLTGIGYVENGDDCDDENFAINPAVSEICDGRDNDCDGGIDEDVGSIYYADLDGDGYGDGTSPINSCEVQAGLVSNTEDCNDDPDNNGAEQYPGSPRGM